MKIYGEENDDSDFENSGPIYYDFNDQEKANSDGLEGSKQDFKESADIHYDIKSQVNNIQTVESLVEQAIDRTETID